MRYGFDHTNALIIYNSSYLVPSCEKFIYFYDKIAKPKICFSIVESLALSNYFFLKYLISSKISLG